MAVGVLIVAAVAWGFKASDAHSFGITKNISIFSSIIKELDLFYVDSLKVDEVVGEGIDAMLYSLDPYTNYYPEEDQDELEQMLRNSYGGIGSIITYDTKRKRSVISEPYEGMPAATSGLKVGDILMEIDGVDLAGKTNQQVSEMLRGQAGTEFTLKVERPGSEGLLEFHIVRQAIQLPIIPYYGMVRPGVGYINLSTFSGEPAKEFRRALLDLRKQGLTSLIIDLRDNGGGLLDEAIEIANYFVPRGQVLVTTKGKTSQASNTYKTTREPIDADIPIAVLVNSSSASASEILAGSLQDLDRAVIVGQHTFGKGLVQTTRQLPYGATIKLTTSKYYIPSGRCVQAIDYTHRNADGSVGRIPDSLTNVFYTRAGRIVRDGGGITPDVSVELERVPNILYYLVNDNRIFDYATQYCLQHPSIAAPEEFALSDADYEDFKAMVVGEDFKYDQQTEKMLSQLREMAEFEGYLSDASAEFEALERKLTHDTGRDLDYFAQDIRSVIEVEIIKRYYYQRGALIQQLKSDPDFEAALNLLTDTAAYRRTLLPPIAAAEDPQVVAQIP